MKHLVDFHAHILPTLDHGSLSIEDSLGQLALMHSHGIDEVVATSHYYAHIHQLDDFLSRRTSCYEMLLQGAQTRCTFHTKIHLGAEILVFCGLENLEGLEKLTIGNSKTLLLELPYCPLTSDIETTVARILRCGYDVLLAHADRYDVMDIERLIFHGAKVQFNAQAVSGLFIKRAYRAWLEEGVAVALGSDIHRVDKKAYKYFIKAEKKLKKYHEQMIAFQNEIL